MTQEVNFWHMDKYGGIKCTKTGDDVRVHGFALASRNIPEVVTNTRIAVHAPLMLAEMEKLAQALEDTGFEPEQSFYDAIKKARGM